ncbi:hypothetical protein V2J09_007298, partial [Rumex salicifolius]
ESTTRNEGASTIVPSSSTRIRCKVRGFDDILVGFRSQYEDENASPNTSEEKDITSEITIKWEVETSDAPETPEHYTKVAESKFPGMWDVREDGDRFEDVCILQVYINVAFSKKTVWKGKIEQSTKDECQSPIDANENTHELSKDHDMIAEPLGNLRDETMLERNARRQQTEAFIQATLFNISTLASLFKSLPAKFYSLLESQGNGGILYFVAFAVILLIMQSEPIYNPIST